MSTLCLKARLLFSVPRPTQLMDRAASPSTSSCLKHQRRKLKNQPAEADSAPEFDRNQALPELDSETIENVSIPTRPRELAEFDTNSDSEKLHFSETIGKYLTHLKTIKRPKIKNSQLLDGVNRVS